MAIVISTFLVSSVAVVAGVLGLLFLHGGWESADAGLTLMAGGGVLGSLLVIGVSRDRRA